MNIVSIANILVHNLFSSNLNFFRDFMESVNLRLHSTNPQSLTAKIICDCESQNKNSWTNTNEPQNALLYFGVETIFEAQIRCTSFFEGPFASAHDVLSRSVGRLHDRPSSFRTNRRPKYITQKEILTLEDWKIETSIVVYIRCCFHSTIKEHC